MLAKKILYFMSYPQSIGKAKQILIYGTNNCPFCSEAKIMFKEMNANFEYIDLTNNVNLKKELYKKHNFRTVPMIFVDG